MLHRPISYGLVLGLGTATLAVLLFAARTNGDPDTAPGLGAASSNVVLGAESTPSTGLTTFDVNPPAVCPNTEFVAEVDAPFAAPTLAEPTPTAPVGPLSTPCIHAVAWLASPVP